MSIIRIVGFILVAYLFTKAGITMGKLRGDFHWTDPRGLQPEHHGANFKREMRRFFLYAGTAVLTCAFTMSML